LKANKQIRYTELSIVLAGEPAMLRKFLNSPLSENLAYAAIAGIILIVFLLTRLAR
jgi:hypothetical protein